MNNNNTISNQETQVPKNSQMNDSDYLNDMLVTEKSLSNNYTIVMSEASNSDFYNIVEDIRKETQDMARSLFYLQFEKGWYKLEKADANKISTVSQEYEQKLNELH